MIDFVELDIKTISEQTNMFEYRGVQFELPNGFAPCELVAKMEEIERERRGKNYANSN